MPDGRATEEARAAAFRVLSVDHNPEGPLRSEYAHAYALDVLDAAHDPALGDRRSVALCDVLELLEEAYHSQNPSDAHPYDLVYDRFGRGGE